MTSERCAAQTTSTPGLSAFLTVGDRVIDIGWMASGKLGAIRGRGSFEDLQEAISILYGRYGEYMLGTYRLTIQCEPELPLDSQPFSTLGTSTQPIDYKKQPSTPTSE